MSRSVDDLRAFAGRAQAGATQSEVQDALRSLCIEDLVGVIPMLWSTGGTGANMEAYRDGAQASLTAKLTEKQIGAMSKLECAINRFNRGSTVLAIAMIIIAAAQLAVAWIGR